MRIDASGHGQKSRIGRTVDADTTVVFGDVSQQPVYGVPGVGAFVDEFGVMMIGHGAAHDEGALGFVTATNVLKNENVAAGGKLGLVAIDRCGSVSVNAIGRALHEERKRSSVILGAQNDGVELDAIAHGNHHFFARVFEFAED